jgi:hypothetical protein
MPNLIDYWKKRTREASIRDCSIYKVASLSSTFLYSLTVRFKSVVHVDTSSRRPSSKYIYFQEYIIKLFELLDFKIV